MPENSKKDRDNRVPAWFINGTLGIFLMVLGIVGVLFFKGERSGLLCSNIPLLARSRLINLDTQTSRFILQNGIPFLERSVGEDDPFTLFSFNWTQIYWRLAANLKDPNPQEIIKTQFPLLALVAPEPPARLIKDVTLAQPPDQTEPEPVVSPSGVETTPTNTAPVATLQPAVLIYHTHTSESYLPASGKDHLYPRGDIFQVGSYLQQVLENRYSIPCIHAEEIHDQIPFRESYQRSQLTLKKYLKEYPNLQVVLDVHRDATPGVKASCVINGKQTATIGIVVGSDKMGLPHPNWRKNHQFAQKLAEAMNLYYPGLNSRVLITDARYNQHLHDHALLIEFGDQHSTLEEVNRAADLFASVLALVLHEEAEAAKTGSDKTQAPPMTTK